MHPQAKRARPMIAIVEDDAPTRDLFCEILTEEGYQTLSCATAAVIYSSDQRFSVGGSQVVRQSESDAVTVVAVGITVHEALKACDQLNGEGVAVRLIDAYSVKPLDKWTLQEAARASEGRLVVVEDHWVKGGLGEVVLEAFTVDASGSGPMNLWMIHLAVKDMPGSGRPAELLEAAGIGARHIADAVRQLLKEPSRSIER